VSGEHLEWARVLVVDDDPDLRDLVDLWLTRAGRYEVDAARDGAEALAAVEGADYEVIVLDMTLPDIIGVELLPRLRQLCPGARVVVFSGLSDADTIGAALAGGAVDYVVKAGDMGRLVSAVGGVHVGDSEASISLAAALGSVSRARRFLLRTLAEWDCPIDVDAAELICSELVTNAVLHGRSPALVRLLRRPPGLRLEVQDRSPASPAPRQADDDDEGGRGLALVSVLAAAWGVDPAEVGKTVWADFAEHAA
jgi:CheY-like chemotaxis protein